MAILKDVRIGNQRLILGDCREIIGALTAQAIVTDPPYGLGKRMQGGTWGAKDHDSGFLKWDLSAPDWLPEAIGQTPAIIWGGNYFGLPASGKWLSWDKMQSFSGADFELAWTNLTGPSKVFRMSRIEAYGSIDKQHPTQKPVALMEWCLGFLPDAKTILDPFMGSGTTLVACQRMGRHGTGIELDEEYWRIACERVHQAARQPDLLIPETRPQPTQEAMDL